VVEHAQLHSGGLHERERLETLVGLEEAEEVEDAIENADVAVRGDDGAVVSGPTTTTPSPETDSMRGTSSSSNPRNPRASSSRATPSVALSPGQATAEIAARYSLRRATSETGK
jgi:hypothetical protein